MASNALKQVSVGNCIHQSCKLTSPNAQVSATPPTLQQAQTAALLTLLNLNNPIDPSSSPLSNITKSTPSTAKLAAPPGPAIWKVLILDQCTKDILATVLRVQDLRDVGVTLHVYVQATYIDIRADFGTGSYIPLDQHCPMYLLCTLYLQHSRTSSAYRMTLRRTCMSLSTSILSSPFPELFSRSSLQRSRAMVLANLLNKYVANSSWMSSAYLSS